MMYEKAIADVIDFSDQELFMAMSHQAALNWVLTHCSTFSDENPEGIKHNGKFLCTVFTDSDDGTFQHTGNNWHCRSYTE